MVAVSIANNQWVQGSLAVLLTHFPGIFSKARQHECYHWTCCENTIFELGHVGNLSTPHLTKVREHNGIN